MKHESGRNTVRFVDEWSRSSKTDAPARDSGEDRARPAVSCREVLERTPLGCHVLDSEGTILEVNRTWLNILDYSRDEVLGRPLREFLSASGAGLLQENLGRLHSDDEAFEIESEMVCGNGDRITVALYGRFAPDERGQGSRIHCTVQDITKQRRLREQIRKKERFLSAVLESVQDGISVIDSDFTICRVNEAMRRWAVSDAPLEGKKCYEAYRGQSEPCSGCCAFRCLQSGKTEYDEFSGPPGSSAKWVEVASYPMRDPESGKVEYVAEFVRDITHRKNIEEALRESEERFQLAMEASRDGIWDWNPVTDEDYYSPGYVAMLGYTQDDVPHDSSFWIDHLHPEDRDYALQVNRDCIENRRDSFEIECRMKTKSGRTLWILDRGKAVARDSRGRATRLVGTHTDITERKKAEQALQEAYAKLEQRVSERTAELIRVNEILKEEVEIRKRAENREQRRSRILTAIAAGERLTPVLDRIVESIETEDPESICSILLVDEQGQRLLPGSAPHLPQFFNQAIHGLPIGPSSGSCGTAAYKRQLVIARDVMNHPCWSDFRDLARQAGLRACWSQPVFSSRGNVIATFAVYYREPRTPKNEDIERIGIAASLASLAIEGKQAEEALRKSHEELELRVEQRTAELQRTNEQLKEEIAGRRQMEEQLKEMSLKDSLTGLYNRAFFEEEMKRLADERYLPLGVIVCDINGLKLINDTIGHNKGDELIQATAGILRQCFRTSDIIARMGGDEFAVLLPRSSEDVVVECMSRIRQEVEGHNERNPGFGLSVSIGYAIGDEPTTELNAVFKRADDSMYKEKLQQSHSSRSETVQALIKTLEARDYITEGHAGRLHDYAQRMGKTLGLTQERLNDLQLLARFHDLGKVGIPDSILFKPGPLTEEEFEEMKRHCEIGHRIALSLSDLAPIADYILKHHEHWDGRGYPLGLSGEAIPLECRILAIVDAYDTMTSERPYKKPVSCKAAVEELQRCAGTQFDPELVERFVLLVRDPE